MAAVGTTVAPRLVSSSSRTATARPGCDFEQPFGRRFEGGDVFHADDDFKEVIDVDDFEGGADGLAAQKVLQNMIDGKPPTSLLELDLALAA